MSPFVSAWKRFEPLKDGVSAAADHDHKDCGGDRVIPNPELAFFFAPLLLLFLHGKLLRPQCGILSRLLSSFCSLFTFFSELLLTI